jgi:hypothetical protein
MIAQWLRTRLGIDSNRPVRPWPTRPKFLRLELERLEDRTAPALVAAYSFNEGTGATVADLSGNANTGTIANATWTTSGKYGNAPMHE